jgi:hypothetical protein
MMEDLLPVVVASCSGPPTVYFYHSRVISRRPMRSVLEGLRYGCNQKTQVRFLIGANFGAGYKKIPSLVKSGFGVFSKPEEETVQRFLLLNKNLWGSLTPPGLAFY